MSKHIDAWMAGAPDMSDFPKKYPELFENVYCGYSCGVGWHPLLHKLCKQIQHHAERKKMEVRIAQIKEKFGGVRVYLDGADDYIYGLIAMAEDVSSLICEDCGTTMNVECKGIRGKGSWIKTLSGACRIRRQTSRQWSK